MTRRPSTHTCALVTGSLDVGGVETVVALLARQLPQAGVRAVVLTSRRGRTARDLDDAGIEVLEVATAAQAREVLTRVRADVVQLHGPPAHLADAALASGLPLVRVVHNVEIHRDRSGWHAEARIARAAVATIAVSATVRDHHLARLSVPPRGEVVVIPNGVPRPPADALDDETRRAARRRVARVLGTDADLGVLVVCLARYDAQKNIPGTVSAFLDAADRRPDLRLVVAGAATDWVEVRHADALRRAHPRGSSVHLLGDSHALTLLAAADAFALTSFFEGWPVAATEAAAMGLPLLLADVGGAAELVGEGGARGVVVPNPAGDPAGVDDGAVRRARRRPHGQRSRAAVTDALVRVHDEISVWAERREAMAAQATEMFGYEAMVAAHAAVLRTAVNGAGAGGP